MPEQKIVNHKEWIAARRELLKKEKALTKQRAELASLRQALPWVKVEKDYKFQAGMGDKTLLDLFGSHSQLITYHFMMGPDWEQGCKSCSYLADHFQGAVPHLAARDVSFVAVSRAPLANIASFQKRMNWDFPWVSSLGSDFNFDYQVSFTEEQVEAKSMPYNFGTISFGMGEAPGVSVFAKQENEVYRTYSAYARGLDPFITAYQFLDIVPKGRDEEELKYGMEWVRHHDSY